MFVEWMSAEKSMCWKEDLIKLDVIKIHILSVFHWNLWLPACTYFNNPFHLI